MTSIYAVVDPATGETVKEYPTITDDDLRAAIGRADDAHRDWSSDRDRGGPRRARATRRRAALGAAQGARGDHRAEMGKPVEQALGEVDFCAAIYEFYADNAEELMADEPIKLLDGEGSAVVRRSSLGVAARDHAVELPLLPGGALRGSEPDHRQHDPA